MLVKMCIMALLGFITTVYGLLVITKKDARILGNRICKGVAKSKFISFSVQVGISVLLIGIGALFVAFTLAFNYLSLGNYVFMFLFAIAVTLFAKAKITCQS